MIKLKIKIEGSHIKARVFMGTDRHHLALTGILTMRLEEWNEFKNAIGPSVHIDEELVNANQDN